jgi:hypothetical protein
MLVPNLLQRAHTANKLLILKENDRLQRFPPVGQTRGICKRTLPRHVTRCRAPSPANDAARG